MEQKENKTNSNDNLRELAERLMKLGAKPGNFLHKGSTYLYIPKSKKRNHSPLSRGRDARTFQR